MNAILDGIESTFNSKERLMVEQLKESAKGVKATIQTQSFHRAVVDLKGFILAGGCLTSYFHGEIIND
jgi:hypothetical protein